MFAEFLVIICHINISQGRRLIKYVCVDTHNDYSQDLARTRTWSVGLVQMDHQHFMGPPDPRRGHTARRITTATERGSLGRCSWEVSLPTLTKVTPVSVSQLSLLYNCLADEITASFRRFGPLVVDWPHKAESKSYFPPKGYAFLLFQVRQILFLLNLINICVVRTRALYSS